MEKYGTDFTLMKEFFPRKSKGQIKVGGGLCRRSIRVSGGVWGEKRVGLIIFKKARRAGMIRCW